jgi:hypothetical protein
MICDLESVEAPGRLYRLGRREAVWAWPDWAFAGTDGTFGNRYDDSKGQYRVLYASSQRLGTFLETLARFRPDPAIVAEPIETDPADEPYPTNPPGVVPASWLRSRAVGSSNVAGEFADVGHSRSLEHLRARLAARLIHYGLDDLDGATIRLSAPRGFTQSVSRYVFECADANGEPAYSGIRYLSRLGDEILNWAIFEPAQLTDARAEPLTVDDPDLRQVLTRFGLRLVGID